MIKGAKLEKSSITIDDAMIKKLETEIKNMSQWSWSIPQSEEQYMESIIEVKSCAMHLKYFPAKEYELQGFVSEGDFSMSIKFLLKTATIKHLQTVIAVLSEEND